MNRKTTIFLSFIFILNVILSACKDEELPQVSGNNKIELTISVDTVSYLFSEISCALNHSPNFEIEQHGFCWDTIPGVNIEKQHTSIGNLSNQNFTSNIEVLLPNKTYYAKAYMQNGDVVIYSNEIKIQTLDARPVVLTTDISNIKANQAESGGTVSSFAALFPITQRGICWAKTINPTITDSITLNGTGNGTFIATMSNLDANTTYYVRAYAINTEDITYGTTKTVTTKDGIPEITTADITDITTNSAIGGGNIIDDEGLAITARGVCWSLNQNPSIADNKTIDGADYGEFISNLTSLSANSTYYVRAYATNSIGTAYGTQQTFKTYYSYVTDIDGNEYFTVQIGAQVWMAENLKTTKYQNGDLINDGSLVGDYSGESEPKYWFAYNDDLSNIETYGRLYTWYTVDDSRDICPDGWHIPSDSEWNNLQLYLGMSPNDIDLIGESDNGISAFLKETGTTYWLSPNVGATNSSGFGALPAGYRRRYNKDFEYLGQRTFFWTSSAYNDANSFYRSLSYDTPNITRTYNLKNYGFSVRCIKN